MFIDRVVDRYDEPHANLCGDCTLCLEACPTDAFAAPGVVDARRCIAYHTIENRGLVPLALRPKLTAHVFGCDVCQEVCPFNRRPSLPSGDPRSAARPIGLLSAEQLAALDAAAFARLSSGTALVRARHDGIRRNAALALGAARRRAARPVLERLAHDASALVSEAARWALARLGSRFRS